MKPVIDAPYQPGRLFDAICKLHGLGSDSRLAVFLGIGGAQISKVRHGVQPLSAPLLIRIHEITGMEIREIKALMNDRRIMQRPSRNKLGIFYARRAKESAQGSSLPRQALG
ncbi:MAG: hypothetical protein V4693_21070 [Pseudomonadota bacterium]